MIRIVILLLLIMFGGMLDVSAQCAMCRSTLEVNFSNGSPGVAAGINTGILYLLAMPYLAVTVLAWLWYKSTRNAKKKLFDSASSR